MYASSETHSCQHKAAQLLGLGDVGLRLIPTDTSGRNDISALAAAVQADRAEGLRPFCVVANARRDQQRRHRSARRHRESLRARRTLAPPRCIPRWVRDPVAVDLRRQRPAQPSFLVGDQTQIDCCVVHLSVSAWAYEEMNVGCAG